MTRDDFIRTTAQAMLIAAWRSGNARWDDSDVPGHALARARQLADSMYDVPTLDVAAIQQSRIMRNPPEFGCFWDEGFDDDIYDVVNADSC